LKVSFLTGVIVIWYVFDMTGFPEAIHLSLARAFMRLSRREGSAGDSHLYAVRADHQATPPTYYLSVPDEHAYARLISQFGGRHSVPPPPPAQLLEILKEGESKASTPEADKAAC